MRDDQPGCNRESDGCCGGEEEEETRSCDGKLFTCWQKASVHVWNVSKAAGLRVNAYHASHRDDEARGT